MASGLRRGSEDRQNPNESESSSSTEYHEAIKNAQRRIWIHQTWLPGVAQNAEEIRRSRAQDMRLLLLSFKEGSPIFARIKGRRRDVKDVNAAKILSYNSLAPFVTAKKHECLRFSFGHHPGWIAIVDSFVFWGPTPVDVDNHSLDFLFHKRPATAVATDIGGAHTPATKEEFWQRQFELLWKRYSHDLATEMEYNKNLRDLEPKLWERHKSNLGSDLQKAERNVAKWKDKPGKEHKLLEAKQYLNQLERRLQQIQKEEEQDDVDSWVHEADEEQSGREE